VSIRRRGEDEAGFTLIEVMVALFVSALIMTSVFGLIRNLVQQSMNVNATMLGVEQDQTAGEGLAQFLHATVAILPGSNATTLNANILAGVCPSGSSYCTTGTPESATFRAVLTNPSTCHTDATFATSLTPNEGPNNGQTSALLNYYAVPYGDGCASATSNAPFTYYYYNSATAPVTISSTTTPTATEMEDAVAVAVDVTFLAGPQTPTGGFQSVRPTNLETTIYLQNTPDAPTYSIALGTSGTLAVGSTITVTATVSPVPDGGTVAFTVTGMSACTSPVSVNTLNGTATCQFTPLAGGTYDVTAEFTGTDGFQITSPVSAIVIPIVTSTGISVSLGTVSHGLVTLTAKATVSPTAASGTVEFSLSVCSGSNGSGTCTPYSGSASVSGGIATWSQGSLNSLYYYSVYATYDPAPSSGYAGSTSSTLGWTRL
jgi:prepilin-type N-terminal cleavage/methylation domain-containing protein